MPDLNNPVIGIIPDVKGLGGPASFHQKFAAGAEKRGIKITYDLNHPDLKSVLVIAGSKHLDLLARVKKRGIPIYQRLDGMNWIHRKRFTGVKHYLRSEINNWILQTIRVRLASAIIYQSEFSNWWWSDQYGELDKPISIIYNGIDLEKYSPDWDNTPLQREIKILVVEGHLKNGVEIGLYNAIRAIRDWDNYEGKPIKIQVASDVPQPIREKVNQMVPGRVTWLGVLPRAKIPEVMQKSDIYFSVELNPACPNSVIESLACGLPVLAFESGAIRELVDDSSGVIMPYGGDIWKLDPADTTQMTQSGSRILANVEAYRQHARKRAEEHFGLDGMVEKYLGMLLS